MLTGSVAVKPPFTRAQFGRAFGMTVRALRLRAGLAQETLALEAGIGRAYMGALERGLHNPTLEMAYRVLPFLGVTFVEFAAEFEKHLRRVARDKNP